MSTNKFLFCDVVLLSGVWCVTCARADSLHQRHVSVLESQSFRRLHEIFIGGGVLAASREGVTDAEGESGIALDCKSDLH